ncbi:unnamed protein product [Rodentolepis nana]|uniref:CBS domain-containing protein n=1 Tax=Rodentolepis nana TaxID=102285 RepID=A0A0R3TWQ7_RODNA|nr:unnamed protein product [Rodentolepis nana]
MSDGDASSVPIRQPYQTRYKLPLMNWSVLRSQQLRNTIFVGMNDEKIIESLDMDRFEELFRLSSNSILSKAPNESKSVTGNGENAPDSTTVVDGDSRNSVTSKKVAKKRLMDASRLRTELENISCMVLVEDDICCSVGIVSSELGLQKLNVITGLKREVFAVPW